MSLRDLAMGRSSCRDFLEGEIDRAALTRCLDAARLAPSACNSQPWYFVCVRSGEERAALAAAAFSGIYSMNSFARPAGCLVCVLTGPSSFTASAGGAARGTPFNRIDVGLAVGHFLLQAQEEGLATCLLGWFDEKAVKKLLKLPRAAKVDLIIAVGHARRPGRAKERKSLEEISRFI